MRQGRKGALHLQLSCDEGTERRPPDAVGLGAADLLGVGARQGRCRRQGASDAKARSPALPDPAGLHEAGRRGARSLLRDRDDRRRGAAAGPQMDRDRARAQLCEGCASADRCDPAARRERDDGDGRQAQPAARRLWPAGRKRDGSGGFAADGLEAPLVGQRQCGRLDRLRRTCGLDPQGWGDVAGRAVVQRLDVLARRT